MNSYEIAYASATMLSTNNGAQQFTTPETASNKLDFIVCLKINALIESKSFVWHQQITGKKGTERKGKAIKTVSTL